MRQWIARLWFGCLALVLIVSACNAPAAFPTSTPSTGVTTFDPPIILSAFTMTAADGSPADLATLKGHYTLLSFGYTHCPDVCPITLGYFTQIKAALAEDAAGLTILFVSVDGARDTPERLREYLNNFDKDFLGFTGDDAAARALIGQFGGQFTLNNGGGLRDNYTVDHTASSYLVNPQGEIIRKFSYGSEVEIVAKAIRQALKG
ncbi:MAG TPA: SCO family protein [Aggregatilineales bacterium]|nr:SCO family protein [Anaerolineales bacterium]HRE47919.1 SCO family protein [Aggregatilineales bacterium]